MLSKREENLNMTIVLILAHNMKMKMFQQS